MIGFIYGKILFSNGKEVILHTSSGVGYQIYFYGILMEGQSVGLFISQIIRENSVELFGHETLGQKKLFEILLSVKGVGPKSAYSLTRFLNGESLINAIVQEDKKVLQKAPGIGAKAASQIILDLKDKIKKISLEFRTSFDANKSSVRQDDIYNQQDFFEMNSLGTDHLTDSTNYKKSCEEALMAFKELGFSEKIVFPKIQNILCDNPKVSSEQLVRLVLQQI